MSIVKTFISVTLMMNNNTTTVMIALEIAAIDLLAEKVGDIIFHLMT
ncbi:MAG: hypothetical protein ACXAEU_21725 [Candidatus Hodarchaeales archaeon]|jgi:hypothetical protein